MAALRRWHHTLIDGLAVLRVADGDGLGDGQQVADLFGHLFLILCRRDFGVPQAENVTRGANGKNRSTQLVRIPLFGEESQHE